jgi:hypothetical protein
MNTRLWVLFGSIVGGFLVASATAKDNPAETLSVDKAKKSITIPCKMAPRKLPNLKEIYPLEVVASFPAPKGQKAHETLVTFHVKPSEIHKALEGLGLKPGKPVQGEGTPTGPEVKILIEFTGPDGQVQQRPIEQAMIDKRTGKPVPPLKWLFTGSAYKYPDPEKDDKVYGADMTGTLMTIFPVTNDTVFQTNLTLKEEKGWKLEVSKDGLPKEGTPVQLIIQVK